MTYTQFYAEMKYRDAVWQAQWVLMWAMIVGEMEARSDAKAEH